MRNNIHVRIPNHRHKHGLKPLADRLGPFAGFDGMRSKQEQIYAVLAPLARQVRTSRPVWFYAMPEVAAFFAVALRTVGAVYRRLEHEGLVGRIRGVGTVVATRKTGVLRTRVPVRGVVALLQWLPGFLRISDQRFFIMQLERSLWERNFATTLVFYHEEEKCDPAFVDRILAHRPDFAIWLMPGLANSMTMNALNDAGVHVVAIADRPQVQTRTSKYVISWQRGRETALRTWRQAGISRVIVAAESHLANPVSPDLAVILRELGLTVVTCPIGTDTMEQYVTRLTAKPAGVIFDSGLWHAQVCTQAPRAFAQLLARRRVLNRWTLPIAAGILGDVRTDAIMMPWSTIITRIVGDLNTGAIFHMTDDHVFHAAWMPQVPAASISQLYEFESWASYKLNTDNVVPQHPPSSRVRRPPLR